MDLDTLSVTPRIALHLAKLQTHYNELTIAINKLTQKLSHLETPVLEEVPQRKNKKRRHVKRSKVDLKEYLESYDYEHLGPIPFAELK